MAGVLGSCMEELYMSGFFVWELGILVLFNNYWQLSYINSHDIIADYLRRLGRGSEGRDQGHYIHAGQGGQGVGHGGRGQGGTQEGFDVI